MKRIIYKKMNDNQYQSKWPIDISDSRKAIATYDINTKTFAILDLRTNDVLVRGSASSKHKILIKVKQALETLGASFEKEKRYFELDNIVSSEG
jgi:uncharacterized protein YdaL